MANVLTIGFYVSFISDGSSTTLVVDFSLGPVAFANNGVSVIPNAKLASGYNSLGPSSGAISSASLSRGVLTVQFSVPPNEGNQSLGGILEF